MLTLLASPSRSHLVTKSKCHIPGAQGLGTPRRLSLAYAALKVKGTSPGPRSTDEHRRPSKARVFGHSSQTNWEVSVHCAPPAWFLSPAHLPQSCDSPAPGGTISVLGQRDGRTGFTRRPPGSGPSAFQAPRHGARPWRSPASRTELRVPRSLCSTPLCTGENPRQTGDECATPEGTADPPHGPWPQPTEARGLVTRGSMEALPLLRCPLPGPCPGVCLQRPQLQ